MLKAGTTRPALLALFIRSAELSVIDWIFSSLQVQRAQVIQ